MPTIIWQTCLFARSSVQRLNKHSLAYATHYCFPEFVRTNQPQIRPWMWAGCREIWGWLLMMWRRREARERSTPPSSLNFVVQSQNAGAAFHCRHNNSSAGAHLLHGWESLPSSLEMGSGWSRGNLGNRILPSRALVSRVQSLEKARRILLTSDLHHGQLLSDL